MTAHANRYMWYHLTSGQDAKVMNRTTPSRLATAPTVRRGVPFQRRKRVLHHPGQQRRQDIIHCVQQVAHAKEATIHQHTVFANLIPLWPPPAATAAAQVPIGGYNQLLESFDGQTETSVANLLDLLSERVVWHGTELATPVRHTVGQRMDAQFTGHSGGLALTRGSTWADCHVQMSGPGPMVVRVPKGCATSPDPR